MIDNDNTPAKPLEALSLGAALATFATMAIFLASNLMA